MAENTDATFPPESPAAVEALSQTDETVGLNVGDINNAAEGFKQAVEIIDYACGQGAFKGWETIDQVAQSRNRLVQIGNRFAQFLQTIQAPAQASAEEVA